MGMKLRYTISRLMVAKTPEILTATTTVGCGVD